VQSSSSVGPFLLRIVLVVFTLAAEVQAQQPPGYPPPGNLGDGATLGLGIQRTMTLLASSTPEHRNTVKVLFYGQSITEQEWWKAVADDLKKRFPSANLIIENRALGGFASQILVKSAETDLYPFDPDLLIFYVYGSHIEYENIIRRTRERTSAEILIQMDHVNNDANLTEETDPAKLKPDGKIWNSFMNYLFLPGIVKKYNTGAVDQRNLWKQYLKDNQLPAKQLLKDGVHLNAHGNYVMAEFVKAYLVKRDDAHIDPMNCETVKTYSIGKEIQWKDGKLTLAFEGNRIDVVLRDGKGAATKILIDGKRPSEISQLYGFTRALAKPGGKWPAIMNLKSQSLPLVEDWTMQARKDPANDKLFTFTIAGSKTGPDGEGRSDQPFISKSGRIVITPECWADIAYSLGLAGVKPIPADFTIRWSIVPNFVDELVAPAATDKSIETVVTLAKGLENSKHTLEVTGPADTPIAAIRVYRPPLTAATKP
jgi:hypothetical protein